MAFMKRHINFFLIFAVGFSIVLLGVISYYYQGTFKEVITNYQSTKTSLKKCSGELHGLKDQYKKAELERNTSRQDIVKYGELYDEKSNELEKTEGKLKATEGILSRTQNSLEETKGLYEDERKKSDSLQEQINAAMGKISDLEGRNAALRRDYAQLSAELAACKSGS